MNKAARFGNYGIENVSKESQYNYSEERVALEEKGILKMFDVISSLESICEEMKTSLKKGGATAAARNIANTTLEHILDGYDLKDQYKTTMESHGFQEDDFNATQVAIEGVGSAISNAYKWLVEKIKAFWKWLVGKKDDEMIEATEDKVVEAEKKKIKKKLKDGKVNDPEIDKELEEVENTKKPKEKAKKLEAVKKKVKAKHGSKLKPEKETTLSVKVDVTAMMSAMMGKSAGSKVKIADLVEVVDFYDKAIINLIKSEQQFYEGKYDSKLVKILESHDGSVANISIHIESAMKSSDLIMVEYTDALDKMPVVNKIYKTNYSAKLDAMTKELDAAGKKAKAGGSDKKLIQNKQRLFKALTKYGSVRSKFINMMLVYGNELANIIVGDIDAADPR